MEGFRTRKRVCLFLYSWSATADFASKPISHSHTDAAGIENEELLHGTKVRKNYYQCLGVNFV